MTKVSPIGAGSADEGLGEQLHFSGPPSPIDPNTGQAATWLIQLLNDLRNGTTSLWASGPTTQYPTDPYLGQLFFDTTLGAIVYCSAVRIAGSPATPAVWTQLTAGSSSVIPINTQTASYTLALSDAGGCVEMNVAGANNLTIPTNASVAFPIGTIIMLRQEGAGATTIVAAGGVTLHSPRTLVFAAQYATASLHKRATNDWRADGDLT